MNKDIDWVWGVDVRSELLAISFLPLEAHAAKIQANFIAIDKTKGTQLPERLVQTLERAQLAVESWSRHFPPVAVRVELPVGRFPSPSLTATWAVTLVALRQGLPAGLLLDWKTPKNWMDQLGIRARAGEAGKRAIMESARMLGYSQDDQDGADATCVGESLRRELWVAGLTGTAVAA
jgi:hypothetical protein